MINQIQSFLTENAKQAYQCHQTRSFNVFIDPKEAFTYLNYAIPCYPIIHNFNGEYEEISRIFKDHNRSIRFEFLKEFAPQLNSLLLDKGLKEEAETDFMICSKQNFVGSFSVEGLSTYALDGSSTIERLKDFRFVQELAFDESNNLGLDSINHEDVISRIGDGLGFIGYMNNHPVVASQYTAILNGITELLGVATHPLHRNRGLGSKIATIATETAFRNGANIVCLSAADGKASSIYHKIGFRKVATMCAYS